MRNMANNKDCYELSAWLFENDDPMTKSGSKIRYIWVELTVKIMPATPQIMPRNCLKLIVIP